MAIKHNNPKLCSLLLLLLTLSLLTLPSHSYKPRGEEEESPEGELFQCFLRCGKQPPNDHDLTVCEKKCVDRFEQTKRQQREEGGGGGGGDEWSFAQTEEPRKVYERCQSGCDEKQGSKSQEYQCRRTCQHQYDEMRKHRRQERHGGGGDCGCGGTGSIGGHDCGCGGRENHHQPIEEQYKYKVCQSRCGREEGQQRRECEQKCRRQSDKQTREHGGEQERERRNPYFFDSQRFESRFRTEEGHIKTLGRFSKKSELLQGIDNYRLSILVANPNTFVLPHHLDAESIFFVVGGKGTVSMVYKEERQSFNLKEGDLIRVPAGAIVYLVNSDDNERLYVLNLLQPVNAPGNFKAFFGVGGENPESFLKTFSDEILEAAFNTPREKVEKIFGQKGEGAIIKASKEQIQALSKESEGGGKTQKKWSPINLKNQTPIFSNQFGQYFEVSPVDHNQLKDLDVSVGFMNINKGGMIAPYYNSRSTKVAVVVGGGGYFEMACPHLAEQSREREQDRDAQRYAKVRARLSVGDAFVVPAGHPLAVVASGESGLQLASFGINGAFNEKQFLAGKKNVWKEVEREAKALAFGTAAEEVEEILEKQEDSYFVAGPERREKGRRHGAAVASILDFTGF